MYIVGYMVGWSEITFYVDEISYHITDDIPTQIKHLNTVISLILILSHTNCHAWSYTKKNTHMSAIYRMTNAYMFRIPGKYPPRTKYWTNLRKTKQVFV